MQAEQPVCNAEEERNERDDASLPVAAYRRAVFAECWYAAALKQSLEYLANAASSGLQKWPRQIHTLAKIQVFVAPHIEQLFVH
jgi:hypothetical protein